MEKYYIFIYVLENKIIYQSLTSLVTTLSNMQGF